MSVWSNLIRWFGGGGYTRQVGQQSGSPHGGGLVTVPVTADSAMQLSAVWACARIIAETVAALPLEFFKIDSEGRWTPNDEHALAQLLSKKPNRYQTRVEFFETIVLQLVLHGNCYCVIGRLAGKIVSLTPIMSAQVDVTLMKDGSVVYTYNDGTAVSALAEENVWHVKLMGTGVIGLSPLAHARNSIGVAISAEKRVAKMANSGFKPAGVLMLDKLLKPDQREQIRTQFADLAEGTDDPLRVLEAGMTYQAITMSPKDVQLLESRQFQIEDICRFFGVPPVLVFLGSQTPQQSASLPAELQRFYKFTLRPYLERFEASIVNRLIPVAERSQVGVEFDFTCLLRGDDAERFKTYKEAVQGGVKTPNECRAREGDAPMPGGDKLFLQAQMVPLEMLPKIDAPKGPPPASAEDIAALRADIRALMDRAPSSINVDARTTVSPAAGPTVNINPEVEEVGKVVTDAIAALEVNVAAPAVTVEAPEVTIVNKEADETHTTYTRDAKSKEVTGSVTKRVFHD